MLAAGLCLATARATLAADAAPAAPANPVAAAPAPPAAPAQAQPAAGAQSSPAASEQELAEITVHGKRLQQAITDAEDNFYQLYNKVDKDDKYHTSCVYLTLDRDTKIQRRVCIPGFVADAMADWAVWRARCQPPQPGYGYDEYDCLDTNKDNRLSLDEAAARPELESDFTTLDTDGDGYLSRQEFAAQTTSSLAVYQPPPPQLVLMEGSKDWYKHMMQVVNADPRLKEMAGHLDDLYHELAVVQQQYGNTAGEVKKTQPAKVATSNMGPRSQ